MKRILLCLMVALFATGCLFAKNNDEKMNVMSYNIRYDNSGDKDNQWKFRRDFAADLVKFHEADVFGAQEVLNNQLNDLLDRLPEYAYVGVGRENAVGKKGWDAACERVATWAILKDKNTGKKFFFLNTHLDHMGKVARHEGASLVLEQAKKLSENLPIIVTGDFNAVPSDEPIQVLTNPSDPRHLTHSRTIAGFTYGPEWTFHDFGKIPYDKREWIDYIFVKGNIKVLRHGVLTETLNNLFPSDHCPVISTLILE